ncbi:uncharacterized protein LOC105375434 isoform X2 [Homo sapiens]|uniref:uncharacterized protein LOC105375434 isoform X2 n=1 Tax=Homo sapiens TaxID=9606 RepID=UPI001FB0DB94|nr:uncharacterized protein LOC105375434 isoform X2 [Homo sapiens]
MQPGRARGRETHSQPAPLRRRIPNHPRLSSVDCSAQRPWRRQQRGHRAQQAGENRLPRGPTETTELRTLGIPGRGRAARAAGCERGGADSPRAWGGRERAPPQFRGFRPQSPRAKRRRVAGGATAAGARVLPNPSPPRWLRRGRQQLQAALQLSPPRHRWGESSPGHSLIMTFESDSRASGGLLQAASPALTKMAAPVGRGAEAILVKEAPGSTRPAPARLATQTLCGDPPKIKLVPPAVLSQRLTFRSHERIPGHQPQLLKLNGILQTH